MKMVSGDRYQVSGQAWDRFVGDLTPAEFMRGYKTHSEAVSAFVEWLEEDPVFYWQEMCAEYTLSELLERYLEDHQDEL